MKSLKPIFTGGLLAILASHGLPAANAQPSQQVRQFAVAGIAVGSPSTNAVGRAQSLGYAPAKIVERCPKDYGHETWVNGECPVPKRLFKADMRNGDETIDMDFVEFPNGSVVREVSYAIRNTTTTLDEVIAEMTDRYGAPTKTGRYTIWCADTCNTKLSVSMVGPNTLLILAVDNTLMAKASQAYAERSGRKASF
ncbi:hypothetical protein K7H13_13010 [Qipengyuania citrea]|uniref:hypothetical protein n=1 Tax=Qipengyuania citrea TaxID=225971 RepID=UPI001E47B00E|nr:hypothetical protein [Qipengyuania citrea]MCD1591666.1 hypothetical protein [Qipengyuania citrea]